MMIVSISWKNIWRNKTRSWVVILAIGFGLFGTLFMIALMNGLMEQKIDASISNETSSIQVHTPEFLENKSIDHLVEDVPSVITRIRQTDGIKAVCHRIKASGMASTAISGNGVMINGIEPEKEKDVTDIHRSLVKGSYFEKSFRNIPTILIGSKLAKKLNAGVGSKVVITIQDTGGELTSGLYRVVGIFKTSNSMFDETNVFVERKSMESLTGVRPTQTSEIAVLLKNNEMTEEVTRALQKKLPGLSVMSWKDIDPTVVAMVSLLEQFSYFMVLIIMVALTFVIVNAMLMAILERTRELGMLMAIGMNKRKICMMILTETTFLAVTGAILGILISFIVIKVTQQQGINFAAWAEGFEQLGYSALIHPTVQTYFYIFIGLISILTAAVASIWPARKALKLEPAKAVREDV